jgi:hypothetical protein
LVVVTVFRGIGEYRGEKGGIRAIAGAIAIATPQLRVAGDFALEACFLKVTMSVVVPWSGCSIVVRWTYSANW